MHPAPLIALVVACTSSAHAQVSLDWYTIDCGGGTVTSGTLTLSGTIGQHDAGRVSSGSLTLIGGYWGPVPEDECVADWNNDTFVNTSDFLAYLNDYNAVLGGGNPTFGDPDLVAPFGVLNTSDFLGFLNLFTQGC